MGYQRRVHGEFSELSVIMQFLIAASLLVAGSTAQLVTYPNGAVAPFDPNVAIATANHYAAKIAHGSYFPYAGALGVHPAAAVYGRKKREAQLPVNLVSDTPTTSDTASLPLLPPSLPPLTVLWCPLSPRKSLMPVPSIWLPTLLRNVRLRSPSALRLDTLPSMPDTPSTTDTAWLP